MDSKASDAASYQDMSTPFSKSIVSPSGLLGLITATSSYIEEEYGNAANVVRRLGEDFAYIRLQDVRNPYKFLKQMEGFPPIRLGTEGFRAELVDDLNPARHYIAFVVMGYRLPYLLALAVLYAWEIAGYLRYRFQWSEADVRNGMLGVRHGYEVRLRGIHVLPGLMAADLGVEPDEKEEVK